MTRLPRILYAVPQLPHVHLEIAKAIQTLAAEDDRRIENSVAPGQTCSDPGLIAEIVRDACGFCTRPVSIPMSRAFRLVVLTAGSGLRRVAVVPPRYPEQSFPTPRPTTTGYRAPSTRPTTPRAWVTIRARRLKSHPKFRREFLATRQAINNFLKAAAYWLPQWISQLRRSSSSP